jgi:hypothetical protein
MKFINILKEDDNTNQWTKEQIGIVKLIIKKGYSDTEYTNIINYLVSIGFDKEEAIDGYYLFKNNVDDEGNFDVTTEPDTDKHWEDFSNEVLALAIHLEIDPSEIEEEHYNHYGLTYYNTSEGEYAVGTESEAEDAAEQAAENLVDEGIVNSDFIKDYITMTDTDRHLYAQEDADNRVDDMSDDDIIEEKDLEDEISMIDAEESDNNDRISELESEVEELEDELRELEEDEELERQEEIKDELLTLNSQIRELEGIDYDGKKEDIISVAREEIREEYYDSMYSELEDPVEYFVDTHGFYTLEELIKNGPIYIDNQKLIKDIVSEDGRGSLLSGYDGEENEQDYDNETYYIYRVN